MKTTRRFALKFPAAALTLALAAAVPLATHARTPDDQLVIGFSMLNVLTLDPGAMIGTEMEYVANMYDYLVETDASDKSKVVPGLAESWAISPDGMTLTFKLRSGVKFQSGNPVTAEDAVWSFHRILKLNLGQSAFWKTFGYSAANAPELITAPDARTVVIKLPAATDPQLMLFNLTSGGAVVVDRKLVLQNQKADDLGAAWLKTNSAGSGAFKLQNWQPNNVLSLERNDGYWRGAPKLKRVIYRHLPESQAQRLAIERGDIDIAQTMKATDITALQGNKDVEIQSTQIGNFYYLGASMKDPKFADKRVRLALRYLIDYEGINKNLMQYYGVMHKRPVQKGSMGDLPDPGYKLDVPMARKLLAEAGYPDGFKTTIRALSDAPFANIATAVQSSLSLVGIKAEVLLGNGEQVYGPMRNRNFELIVGRGGGGVDPHPHSNLRVQIYNPDNRDEAKMAAFQGWRASFQDLEINKLIEAALLERDKKKQTKLYEDIQRKVDAAVPALQPISQAVETVVMRREVKGFRTHPAFTTRFRGVSKSR